MRQYKHCSSDAWWIQRHPRQPRHRRQRFWARRFVGLIGLWNRIGGTSACLLYVFGQVVGLVVFNRLYLDYDIQRAVQWLLVVLRPHIAWRNCCATIKESCCVQCHPCRAWSTNNSVEARIRIAINHCSAVTAVRNCEVNILHIARTYVFTTCCSCIHAQIYTSSLWCGYFACSCAWCGRSTNITTCRDCCRWRDTFATDCSVGCWFVSVRCWYVPRWGDCSIRCHVASGRYPKSLAPSIYVNFRSTWEAVFGIWGRHPYTHHRRTAFRASHSEHPCRLSSRVLWTELDHSWWWYERQMSLVRYLL